MSTAITVVHIIVCFFLMLVVLLQAGKGGGMGAAFGGGGGGGGGSASGSVFGGSGAGGFLRKLTVVSATVFMVTSMTLAYLASSSSADALKRMSAKSQIEKERKEKAHFEALGKDGETFEEVDGDFDAPEPDPTTAPDDVVPIDGTEDSDTVDSADPTVDPAPASGEGDTSAPSGDTPDPASGAPPPAPADNDTTP